MTLPDIIAYIPKIAGVLLVGIGILIAFEVYAIVKPKKASDKENELQKIEPLSTLTFSTKPTIQNKQESHGLPNIPVSHKAIVLALFLLIILVTGLLSFHYVYYIYKPDQSSSANNVTNTTVHPRPTILLYQVTDDGSWQLRTEEQLRQLLRGEQVKVAVSYPDTFTQAEFIINGESIITDASHKSPAGLTYIDYVIPQDKTNFYIEVYVY